MNNVLLKSFILQTHRKLSQELEARRKAESKANELWSKLEHEQNLKGQLALTASHATDKLNGLEKQLSTLQEKLKSEADSNAKLKKSNVELNINCGNKEKLVDELSAKIELLQNLNVSHSRDIGSLQSQLEKANTSWVQINDRIQDLNRE